jgi:hypothetical protein
MWSLDVREHRLIPAVGGLPLAGGATLLFAPRANDGLVSDGAAGRELPPRELRQRLPRWYSVYSLDPDGTPRLIVRTKARRPVAFWG